MDSYLLISFAFGLFFIVATLVKYKEFFNPLSITFAQDWLLLSLIPLVTEFLTGLPYYSSETASVYSFFSLHLYALGMLLGVICYKLFRKNNCSNENNTKFKKRSFGLLILFYFFLFFIMIFNSPSGFDWIINSRAAYQNGRVGFGWLYVSLQLILVISLTASILTSNQFNLSLLLKIIFILFLAFFLGSKSYLIFLVLYSVVLYHFFVRKIPSSNLLFVFVFLLISLFMVIPIYGDFNFDAGLLTYFDHGYNYGLLGEGLADNLDRGQFLLSAGWSYLPRTIFIDKPFVYGDVWLTELISAGSADKGHTLGGPSITFYALAFGLWGVLFSGLILSFISNHLYYSVVDTKNLFYTLLYIHIAIVPVIKHTPILMAIFAFYIMAKFFSSGNSKVMEWTPTTLNGIKVRK